MISVHYTACSMSTINNLLLLKASENADFIISTLNLYNPWAWNGMLVAIKGAVEGQPVSCINTSSIESCKNGTLLLLSRGS